jgi:hypothetical protein
MKRLFLLFFLLVFLSCSNEHKQSNKITSPEISSLKTLPDSVLTKIEVEKVNIDFDTVKKFTPLNGNFMIKNSGKKLLEIKKINGLCNCTDIKSFSKEIEVDETQEIMFSISTDEFQRGYNERFITVYGNFFPFYRTIRVQAYILE